MRPSPVRFTRNPLLMLLEGERMWGGLEKAGRRNGVARYRLVVHPPGLDCEDRIALRLWRAFSVWGLALWLLIDVSLMTVLSPWNAVAVATVTCLVVGAVLMVRAGRSRGAVRTLTAVVVSGANDPDATSRHHELSELAERLFRADARLATGELSAVEHEAEMWRVYDHMDRADDVAT